ncbi:phosphoethanolamine transferase [Nitratifractor sp.]
MNKKFLKPLTQIQLILIVSAYLVVAGNYTFFTKVLEVIPPHGINLLYLASMPILLFIINVAFFTLLSSRYTTKPLLIFVLIVSASVSYFMNSYQVVIDRGMIRSALETNVHEALGLFNFKMLLYTFFLGIVPAWLVYKAPVVYRPWKTELWAKLKTLGILLLVTGILAYFTGGFYASFFREHRPLKNYTNPYYWIKSTVSYVKHSLRRSGPKKLRVLGTDARVIHREGEKPKLIVYVVGEATRWDHFGLNGYTRDTTPKLAKTEGVVNFNDFRSCGTLTAHSVPCMFSIDGRSRYNRDREEHSENLMDVLAHTGAIDLLWRDNNSDPKGVMKRLGYVDFMSPENNPVCDSECRDEGMLKNLEGFLDRNVTHDKLLVLHQMGSHGPEYYKRYTKEFFRYKPVCRSNELGSCTRDEVVNAYDNTVLHTDAFLHDVIDLLKKYEKRYQVALVYVADHGESLGEHGIYLHGLPYMIAPEAQKHVAAVMWFGPGFKHRGEDLNVTALQRLARSKRFSQDNLFSTILGLLDVNTSVYDPKMDILNASE